MARRPFGRREGQGEFAAGELPHLLDRSPSRPILLGARPASEAPHHSISMRSRSAGPGESGCLSGLISSPKPLSVSKPAFLKCLAARSRRSPATSTYATTPSNEPLRCLSSAIPQPHPQRPFLEARPHRRQTRQGVGQKYVAPVIAHLYQQLGPLLREVHAPLLNERELENDVVAVAVLHDVVCSAPEQHFQGLRVLEDVFGEGAKRLQAEHLAVVEARGQDRDGRKRLFDRLYVPRLRLAPAREVGISDRIG